MNVERIKEWARIGSAVLVTFSIASVVQATTTYGESVLGDFNGGQLYTLSDAHNVFVGTQAWGTDKVDGFRFAVQDGQQATIHFNQSFVNLSPNEA